MNLEQEITNTLADYVKAVKEITAQCLQEVSKESVQKLKASSPGKGDYKSKWTVTREGVDGFIVHNKKYWLTHLLENGHLKRNQYGVYGRFTPIKHIEPVEEWGETELENMITRRLS